MDWLQFSASVIGSLAWPAAVVVLVLLLRQPLAKLIPLIRTLKYKELQIDLGEQLQKVRAEVEATTDELTPDASGLASFKSVAETDPRAAILSAWFPVERELRDMANKADLPPTAQVSRIIFELINKGVLDDNIGNTLLSTNRIRNDAAHLTGPDVDLEQALSMEELCRRLAVQLRKTKSNLWVEAAR
ncbi:TPA: hypothetical protein SL829_002110 [Pseudomonas aeruginosa]|nr:hypothetical protein [Pseudomonas aeruginosa]